MTLARYLTPILLLLITNIPGRYRQPSKSGQPLEPESLDPQLVHTLPGMRIVGDLFDGLVIAIEGKIVPSQAESWTVSDDNKTWTFTLRKSHWSNGQPVTADDFVQAWRRAVDPGQAHPTPGIWR